MQRMEREGSLQQGLVLGDEVRAALAASRPVVALESAVVTHGLPDPENLEAVRVMEGAVRGEGAVPAVCLAHAGNLYVGPDRATVERVARDPHREKASVRDLGAVLARGESAGLTVSATIFAARAAGIKVFATGGIGGAHYPVESGDVSADLTQLARTPVVTVCSGAKSVLDVPRTLEMLETLGVPVFAYCTTHFPAFYLVSSGIRVSQVHSPDEVAHIARRQWDLGHPAGLVVGNPIPTDDALEHDDWDGWLQRAQEAAARRQVRGKELTPFLLAHVARASAGRTVRANLALLQNNAALAAQVARSFNA